LFELKLSLMSQFNYIRSSFVLHRGWCGITRGSILPTEAGFSVVYIGVGRAHMSRADMFRQPSGIAVSMEQSVFPVPASFAGEQSTGCSRVALAHCCIIGVIMRIHPTMINLQCVSLCSLIL